MKDSCQFFSEITIRYLKIFQEKCQNWNPDLTKDDGARPFLLTNQGVSSLFLILDDQMQN